MNPGMLSSKTDEWETPQALFDQWDAEFDFELDVCATPDNTKCPIYYTRKVDGLIANWSGARCWMNPPYGREIGKWVKKAYESSLSGATVVCLLPARTDTKWWHDYVLPYAEIVFLKGRIKFGGYKWNAPFPSAIAIYRPPPEKAA